jgi:TonB family protein
MVLLGALSRDGGNFERPARVLQDVRSASIAITAVLLAHCAAAVPRSLPPLQCHDERGRPFPDASQPLRIDGTMTGGRVIHSELPSWPKGRVRFQGVIIMEAIVDRRGRVCAVRLLRGSGPLAESALTALKRWTFEPARINGRPIPVYFTIDLRFCPQ